MRRAASLFVLALTITAMLATADRALAQTQAMPQRPKITGISHVGYFVSNLPKALDFWHGLLGYEVYATLPKPDGSGPRIAFLKINDTQHIELFTDTPAVPHDMMSHLCFTVDDITAMKAFLRAHGYKVSEGNGKTKLGDYAFEIRDPNGRLIEFVQSLPDGQEMQAHGKLLPATRISPRIYHAGYLVGDAEKTIAFYQMLGFTETWRGNPVGSPELAWVNMKVPDGSDYVELMLYHSLGDPSGWGGKNHLSLVVPDIEKSVVDLEARPAFAEYQKYGKPVKINTGINGKRQVNLYDPDGTRVELMEPNTVDGKPRPPSTAPYPPPSPGPQAQ